MLHFSIILILLLLCQGAAMSQVAVIANKTVQVKDFDRTQLLDIYSGEIRLWDDGRPIIVFDLKPNGGIRDTFYGFLGKSTSRMKSLWMKKMLLGEGDPPIAVESEQEMLERVATTDGSIGFIGMTKTETDVKILMTIQPVSQSGSSGQTYPGVLLRKF